MACSSGGVGQGQPVSRRRPAPRHCQHGRAGYYSTASKSALQMSWGSSFCGGCWGQKVLYALVNRSTEVGMSQGAAWRIHDQENCLEPDTHHCGHQSRDGTRGPTSQENNESLKLPMWTRALRSCKMHTPHLLRKTSQRRGKLSHLKE